jgi:hypothetical protein
VSVCQWFYSHFLDLGRFFSISILYTVGRTSWAGDQPVARPLPAHTTAQTLNKRIQTSMPQVRFEPTIPVLERPKMVHASHGAGTVIGRTTSKSIFIVHTKTTDINGTLHICTHIHREVEIYRQMPVHYYLPVLSIGPYGPIISANTFVWVHYFSPMNLNLAFKVCVYSVCVRHVFWNVYASNVVTNAFSNCRAQCHTTSWLILKG